MNKSLNAEMFSAVLQPLHQARGLPNPCYVDDDYYRAECQEIFHKGWFALGTINEVAKKGDVAPKQVAGQNFLIVRNNKGEINVFYNVCRHRGHVLVTEKQNMPLIRCPYHSWCYSHDGALKKTPHIGGSGNDSHKDFTTEDKSLFPVKHGVFMGVIFVNPSADAMSFEEYTQPIRDCWSEFADIPLYSHSEDTSFTFNPACNWKFGIENYCESYHLPWVHPDLNRYSKLEDHYNIEGKSYSGQGTVVYQPMLDSDGNRFHQLPNLDAKWDMGGEYLSIYPNLLYGVHKDHNVAVLVLPQSVDSSLSRASFSILMRAGLMINCIPCGRE